MDEIEKDEKLDMFRELAGEASDRYDSEKAKNDKLFELLENMDRLISDTKELTDRSYDNMEAFSDNLLKFLNDSEVRERDALDFYFEFLEKFDTSPFVLLSKEESK